MSQNSDRRNLEKEIEDIIANILRDDNELYTDLATIEFNEKKESNSTNCSNPE